LTGGWSPQAVVSFTREAGDREKTRTYHQVHEKVVELVYRTMIG